MVERATRADRDQQARRNGPSGDPELTGPGHPPVVGHLAGRRQLGVEGGEEVVEQWVLGGIHTLAHRDDRCGVGEEVQVVVTGAGEDLHAAVRRHSPDGRARGRVAPRLADRQHTGTDRRHLGTRRTADRRDDLPAEGRLPRHELLAVAFELDGVAGQPRGERGRDPSCHLAAPGGAGREKRPRRRRARPVDDRGRGVLLVRNRDVRERDPLVGAPGGELGRRARCHDEGHDADRPAPRQPRAARA